MKLSTKEFDAMQRKWRKWYIEKIELKTFEKFGLDLRGADVLEVGCGNGYAAALLTTGGVRSYTGLDVMPEQLAIARDRRLLRASFVQGSADDLSMFPEKSFDAILDFCILHHVEGWRTFFDESRRVLRDGGSIYVADLSKTCIHIVDALLHWGHAEEALFTLKEFEEEANKRGFTTVHKANDLGLEGYFRFRKEEN